MNISLKIYKLGRLKCHFLDLTKQIHLKRLLSKLSPCVNVIVEDANVLSDLRPLLNSLEQPVKLFLLQRSHLFQSDSAKHEVISNLSNLKFDTVIFESNSPNPFDLPKLCTQTHSLGCNALRPLLPSSAGSKLDRFLHRRHPLHRVQRPRGGRRPGHLKGVEPALQVPIPYEERTLYWQIQSRVDWNGWQGGQRTRSILKTSREKISGQKRHIWHWHRWR